MNTSSIRLRSRLAATLILVAGVMLAPASPAWAHGQLERSDPPNGGMVPVGRSTLTLWFSSAVIAEASTFDVRTDDGTEVAARVTVRTSDGQGVITIDVDPLAQGLYRVDWSILSDDGHRSSGSFPFGAGVRPLPGPGGGALPEGSSLLIRWLDLSAIMVAIGALAVSGRVLGSMGPSGEAPLRRSRYLGALAGAVAVVIGVVTLFARTGGSGTLRGTVEASWSTLVGTPWGAIWLLREVALVAAALALWSWARHDGGSGRPVRVAAVAMAVVVCFEPLAGHAADLPARSGLASVAAAAHLVAAGVWAGGLAVLALCLLPVMRREPDARGPMMATAWRTFSPMAAVATVVLVATGLYESGRYLPDLESVTSTVYGGAVLAKVVLIVVALSLAGCNTLLVHPNLAEPIGRLLRRPVGWAPVSLRRFGTVVMVEVSVLVVAAVVAAVLTSVPPARERATASIRDTFRSANVDGLFITFEEVPAGPGTSRLIVQARSTVRPPLGRIVGAGVLLVGPAGATELTLEQVEADRFEATADTTTPGRWQASVAVSREGQPDALMQAEWTAAASSSEAVGPLESATTGIALLLITALAGVLVVARRARTRPSASSESADETAVRQP